MNRNNSQSSSYERGEARVRHGLVMLAGGAALAGAFGAELKLALGLGVVTAVGMDRWANTDRHSER